MYFVWFFWDLFGCNVCYYSESTPEPWLIFLLVIMSLNNQACLSSRCPCIFNLYHFLFKTCLLFASHYKALCESSSFRFIDILFLFCCWCISYCWACHANLQFHLLLLHPLRIVDQNHKILVYTTGSMNFLSVLVHYIYFPYNLSNSTNFYWQSFLHAQVS